MSQKPTSRPKYYRIKRGRAFFEPGKKRAENAGWFHNNGKPKASIPLGEAGDGAEQEALRLYQQLLRDLGKAEPFIDGRTEKYPRGSFGDFYVRWRCGDEWAEMKPRTREDYERCWPVIEQRFANTPILNITVSKSTSFHREMKRREDIGELSPAKRFRILKVWRSLLSQAAAKGFFQQAPIGKIGNPMANGASEVWYADEIQALIKTAEHNGFAAMSLAIWIGWETLLSPCDVRGLTKQNLKTQQDGDGYIKIVRQKTGKQALPYLSRDLVSAIERYVDSLDFDIGIEAPILRMRSGVPYSTKDTFSQDFRNVRKLTFENDKRTFKDIRRSGNLEADLGGASPEERAELLANSLHKNAFLEATYTPPTVTRGKKILEKREAGRKLLKAEKLAKSRNKDGK